MMKKGGAQHVNYVTSLHYGEIPDRRHDPLTALATKYDLHLVSGDIVDNNGQRWTTAVLRIIGSGSSLVIRNGPASEIAEIVHPVVLQSVCLSITESILSSRDSMSRLSRRLPEDESETVRRLLERLKLRPKRVPTGANDDGVSIVLETSD